jgi:hypothetical protein
VVVAVFGTYVLLMEPMVPPSLPLLAGTVIHIRWYDGDPGIYHFVVGAPGGNLMGAWRSDGLVDAVVWAVSAPLIWNCPSKPTWAIGSPTNVTFDESLEPGQ